MYASGLFERTIYMDWLYVPAEPLFLSVACRCRCEQRCHVSCIMHARPCLSRQRIAESPLINSNSAVGPSLFSLRRSIAMLHSGPDVYYLEVSRLTEEFRRPAKALPRWLNVLKSSRAVSCENDLSRTVDARAHHTASSG